MVKNDSIFVGFFQFFLNKSLALQSQSFELYEHKFQTQAEILQPRPTASFTKALRIETHSSTEKAQIALDKVPSLCRDKGLSHSSPPLI